MRHVTCAHIINVRVLLPSAKLPVWVPFPGEPHLCKMPCRGDAGSEEQDWWDRGRGPGAHSPSAAAPPCSLPPVHLTPGRLHNVARHMALTKLGARMVSCETGAVIWIRA